MSAFVCRVSFESNVSVTSTLLRFQFINEVLRAVGYMWFGCRLTTFAFRLLFGYMNASAFCVCLYVCACELLCIYDSVVRDSCIRFEYIRDENETSTCCVSGDLFWYRLFAQFESAFNLACRCLFLSSKSAMTRVSVVS